MYFLATHVVETRNCVRYTTSGFKMLTYNLINCESWEHKLQAKRTLGMRGMLGRKNTHTGSRDQGIFP